MDVLAPEMDTSHDRTRLHMFCPEDRRPREIFWSGFGFQVWCQMLTHVIQSKEMSMFLIDEPDIYLHSDLQRQLLRILRDLGPDIVIATHSTEIVTEAETEELVIINKKRQSASRLKSSDQLASVFKILGSSINPILTQLAKTRKVLFLEGGDFQIIGRLAAKLGYERLANRSDFAVVPVEGFNPERIRSLKRGMEATFGSSVLAAAVLDRDFRSDAECASVVQQCEEFCDLVVVHKSKEVENLLLVPLAIDRTARAKLLERERRGGKTTAFTSTAEGTLASFSDDKKNYVASQYLTLRKRFERSVGNTTYEEVLAQEELTAFDQKWSSAERRYQIIPGKAALSAINSELETRFGVSVSTSAIIQSMHKSEIPDEAVDLVIKLNQFAQTQQNQC